MSVRKMRNKEHTICHTTSIKQMCEYHALINSEKHGVVLKVMAWNVDFLYLCVFVYSVPSYFFSLCFTVNTVLFAALDAK